MPKIQILMAGGTRDTTLLLTSDIAVMAVLVGITLACYVT